MNDRCEIAPESIRLNNPNAFRPADGLGAECLFLVQSVYDAVALHNRLLDIVSFEGDANPLGAELVPSDDANP